MDQKRRSHTLWSGQEPRAGKLVRDTVLYCCVKNLIDNPHQRFFFDRL